MADEKKDETKTAAETKAAEAKAAETKAAETKERTAKRDESKERAAAAQGAEAVARAVQQVAEAVIANIHLTSLAFVEGDFRASGNAGGQLEIVAYHGNNLGTSGTVTVAGMPADTNEWSTNRIFGKVPANVKSGDEVVVMIDDKTKFTGKLQ